MTIAFRIKWPSSPCPLSRPGPDSLPARLARIEQRYQQWLQRGRCFPDYSGHLTRLGEIMARQLKLAQEHLRDHKTLAAERIIRQLEQQLLP